MRILVMSLIVHVYGKRWLKASIDLLKIQPNVPNVMLNMVDALSLLFLFEKNEARKQSFTNFLQKRCS